MNYSMRYYRKHRKKIIARVTKYNKKTKVERLEKTRRRRRKHAILTATKYANKYCTELIAPFQVWCLAKKQKMTCALTGEKLTSSNLSIDHIIPSSKGGRNILSNIRLVIRDVNFMKHNFSDEYFFELCRKVISIHSY